MEIERLLDEYERRVAGGESLEGEHKGSAHWQTEAAVARILALIASVPHHRDHPVEGDLEGQYDIWFDGGAYRIFSGWGEYSFTDGSSAQVPVTPLLRVTIQLPDGRVVEIAQVS